ncbi:TPA: hypothetical protein ACF3SJ_004789, partial [Klebsiella quasipneumoniae subsp. similipneumoniae]
AGIILFSDEYQPGITGSYNLTPISNEVCRVLNDKFTATHDIAIVKFSYLNTLACHRRRNRG